MKVFLCWSGNKSKEAAVVFSKWLPHVLQSVEPFMSSQIPKGDSWREQVLAEIENAEYGIVFLTRENIFRPWINFEAGALYLSTKRRVAPLLIDIEVPELYGPIDMLQAVKFDNDDIKNLIFDINARNKSSVSEEVVNNAFNNQWDELVRKINDIRSIPDSVSLSRSNEEEDIVKNQMLEIAQLAGRIAELLGKYSISSNERRPRYKELLDEWGRYEGIYRNKKDLNQLMRDFIHQASLVEHMRWERKDVRDALSELDKLYEMLINEFNTMSASPHPMPTAGTC
jgi:hypothetical protein